MSGPADLTMLDATSLTSPTSAILALGSQSFPVRWIAASPSSFLPTLQPPDLDLFKPQVKLSHAALQVLMLEFTAWAYCVSLGGDMADKIAGMVVMPCLTYCVLIVPSQAS